MTAGSRLPPDRLLESIRRLTARTASGGWAAELATAIAEELVALLEADAAAVFRFDGDDIVVVGGSAAPGKQVFTRGARFPVEPQMLAAEILRTGAPARSAQYGADPSDAARRITALGVDVVVGAPVVVEGALWGVIYAGAHGPDRLPAGIEQDLNVFAGMATIAVASAEHRARLESQAAEQEALVRVARTVLEGAGSGDALEAVAREAAAMLDGTAAAVLRADGDGDVPVACWPDGDAQDAALAAVVRQERRVVQVGDPDETSHVPVTVLGRPLGWGAPIEIDGAPWGTVLVAADKGTPVAPDAAGRLARFAELAALAIASVEARRDLVAQLVETERFVALVELSDDFIGISELDGGTRYLNPGGRRLLGIEGLEEARSMSIEDFLTDEGRAHFRAVSGPQTRRTGSFTGETTLRHRRTGEAIPVSVNSYMITHPVSGDPVAVAVVQHDLRERKQAEVQLRRHAEAVEQLAAARRDLLVDVLHAEDRMRRQIADALHDHVLQDLYAARMDLERVSADDDALHRARVEVDAAARQLRDAVADLHPASASAHGLEARLRAVLDQGGDRAGFGHRLEVQAEPPSGVDEVVLALVRELVHNTVKHAEATFVVLSLREDDGRLVLEVSDDGRGIAPGRLDEALRAGHIGLASSRERVGALGGRLEVGATPGAGTRVRAEIPLD